MIVSGEVVEGRTVLSGEWAVDGGGEREVDLGMVRSRSDTALP